MKSNAVVRVSPRLAVGTPTYSRGLVLDVTDNVATVKLAIGKQERIRTDVMFGRTYPAQEGETWMVAQEFGDWRFVAYLGIVPLPVQKFTQTVGNGSATSWTIDHGLGTSDVLVQIYNPLSFAVITAATISIPDANNVIVVFGSAPAAGAARVVVIG